MDIYNKFALFEGIHEDALPALLACLGGTRRTYAKGMHLLKAHTSPPKIGLVLAGKVELQRESITEPRRLLATLASGEVFGELPACRQAKTMPISVVACEPCEVLLLDFFKIMDFCPSTCGHHRRLISNLFRSVAHQGALFARKEEYLLHKSIRGRVLAYFNDLIVRSGSYDFTVPYNRNELADFLCVDRSALSRELSNLKRDGIIFYSGNCFRWLQPPVQE